MARHGFIHDKLEIKCVILYVLSRTVSPIDFATVTELSLCDDGIEYFDFAQCLAELVESEHLSLEDGLYAITAKGIRNSEICESSLPYTVRMKSEKNLSELNAILRRKAEVRAEISPLRNGFHTLRLLLDDHEGNLMTLDLLTATTESAKDLSKNFLAHPDVIYKGIVKLLTEKIEDEEVKIE